MSTSEIYKNIPAVRARTYTIEDSLLPISMPTIIPMNAITADTMLYVMACFTVIPAFTNTAKSPKNTTSCWICVPMCTDSSTMLY